MAVLLPNGKQYYTDSATGLPLVGGKVYTYIAGTSTPKATYTTAAATVANANPVILDSRGEATIFWSGAYKIVVKDSLDNIIWTADNIDTTIDIADITYNGVALSAILFSSATTFVNSIVDLKAVLKTKYSFCYVSGYYAAGDGGGGQYYYDSTDTTSADNGGAIIVATDGGRWKLLTNGKPVSVLQFGAKPDYTTDAGPAFVAANEWAALTGTTITVDGVFLWNSAVSIYSGVTFLGKHSPAYGSYPAVSASSSMIIMTTSGDGGEIYGGATVDGIAFMQHNLTPAGTHTLPFADAAAAAAGVAAFSGVAFKSKAGGCAHIKNCTFVGFGRVFDIGSFGLNGALFAENVIFDCKDGFFVGSQFYVTGMRSSFYNCHSYPITTHSVSGASNLRSGTAFSVDDTSADFNQCSSYGYAIGFDLIDAGTNVIGCSVSADDVVNTCIGFNYSGQTKASANIGSFCSNMGGSSIKSDKPADGTVFYDTTITGGTFINGATATSANGQIWFYDGYGSIANCYFQGNGAIGNIKLENATGQVNIDNISVPGDIAPIFGTASTILLARIGNITYRKAAPTLQPLSWTPVVKCGTTVQSCATSGSYTIQNNFVTCYFRIDFYGGAPAGGTMTIEGLPYTCSYAASDGRSSSGCSFYSNLTGAGYLHFDVTNGATKIDCYYATATGSTVIAHGQLNSTTVIRGSVTYKIIT